MEVQKLEQKLKIQIIDFSQGRNPQNKKTILEQIEKINSQTNEREKLY